ncbi:MAG: CBS domain-containing protein [Gammaproteobacteria bacterium]|nr:CBS domain-containing protein [Gammaproteobacteria bacterium]
MGVLSELDCLSSIMNDVYNGSELGTSLVSEYMTTEVETDDPHDDIVDVAKSMLDHKHRRRPVVKNGRVMGQVTCRQILRAVKEFAGAPDAER